MTMPVVTLRQLFEAGVHFGHNTRRWNPKMQPYLFGVRNNVHIIDLEQTVPMFQRGLQAMRDVAAAGGRVLFIGTKHQAQEKIAESAKRCGQYYVDHRWLGGMLTNWKTVSQSIKRLRDLTEKLEDKSIKLSKKEALQMSRHRDKLERALGGIKDMGGLPDIIFIIDTIKENNAITEALKLGIPVVAIVDSNSDPVHINFPIPGNDDASRAIDLYCDLAAQAILDGLEAEISASGKDKEAAPAPKSRKAKAAAAEPAAEAAPVAAAG